MTVAELIEKLKEYPQDAVVAVQDRDREDGLGWCKVKRVDLDVGMNICDNNGSVVTYKDYPFVVSLY